MFSHPLQPLRVPRGWRVEWNDWYDLDPTAENIRRGYFGSSSLLMATHERMRLYVNVEWKPDDDPGGEFVLCVTYTPWLRTPTGRRYKGDNVADPSTARQVLEFRTRDRAAIVRAVEEALMGRPEWQEANCVAPDAEPGAAADGGA